MTKEVVIDNAKFRTHSEENEKISKSCHLILSLTRNNPSSSWIDKWRHLFIKSKGD